MALLYGLLVYVMIIQKLLTESVDISHTTRDAKTGKQLVTSLMGLSDLLQGCSNKKGTVIIVKT